MIHNVPQDVVSALDGYIHVTSEAFALVKYAVELPTFKIQCKSRLSS